MQTRWLVAVLLSVSCGGGKQGSTGPALGGEGDDPATPFHDAALKVSLGDTPGNGQCGIAPGATMGTHFKARKQAMRADGKIVEESFRCTARPDNRWDCEWAVSDTGGGGGGFAIMATVGSDGSVDRKNVRCATPSNKLRVTDD